MKLADLPAVAALSTPQKLELVDEILASVPADDDWISPEEERLIEERWDRYLANPGSALSLEDLKAKVSARIRQR